MRILLLAHAFNSLTQRLWCALGERGHELSFELDISDEVTREAVALHAPALVIASFLKRAIPEDIWRRLPCLIVHPGVPGDRGPAALDWAILEQQHEWGVTVLQADAEWDAGPIWASASFAMRPASKASLYRGEVADAAVDAVLAALERYEAGMGPLAADALALLPRGRWHPPLTQAARAIDWTTCRTAEVLRRLRAADSAPGLLDAIAGVPAYLYDAHPGPPVATAQAGQWLYREAHALLRATVDGSVWIGHARGATPEQFKLPALMACPAARALPQLPAEADELRNSAPRPITYRESGAVGFLRFDFYNGAMGSADCRQLLAALESAAARPTRVLVLEGGRDFWSNGIHLNLIEAADSPADESWLNIEAIDDVAECLVRMTSKLTVAAVGGNAGAGGAFLALAADQVWIRPAAVLNLHYRNMGNLYGSELWTYTLPRRAGAAAEGIIGARQPLLGSQAVRLGLADAVFGATVDDFTCEVADRAARLATAEDYLQRLRAKAASRDQDEALRPLASYRQAELAEMRRSFYGFDTSYHVARHRFVHKAPHSWTPRHLARHRGTAAGR
ncbi:MAG: enoyl-CoA hydratase-related protein [Pseudomonadota bacterium]